MQEARKLLKKHLRQRVHASSTETDSVKASLATTVFGFIAHQSAGKRLPFNVISSRVDIFLSKREGSCADQEAKDGPRP